MTDVENRIPYSGIDPRGRLKFSVLLEMFQEAADIDATKFGLSINQTIEHDITWVLRSYRVDLQKPPVTGDGPLHIKTYAEMYRKLFSLRSFKIWNHKGEFLGSAYTWWVLLDFKKMKPLRVDRCELTKTLLTRVSDEYPAEVRIPAIEHTLMTEEWKVRWNDLDVNDHTNHTVYFNWALDTVPDDVPEKMAPVFAESEYLLPVLRSRVRCVTEETPCADGRSFVHSIRRVEDDAVCAKLTSRWKSDGRKILEQ